MRTALADSRGISSWMRVVEVMREAPRDVPFGFIYRLQANGGDATARQARARGAPARADVAVRDSG